jgi:hypothetical protein
VHRHSSALRPRTKTSGTTFPRGTASGRNRRSSQNGCATCAGDEGSEARKRRRGSATLALLILPPWWALTPARIQSIESIPTVLHAEAPPPPVLGRRHRECLARRSDQSAEVYSNGLRIELPMPRQNRPRSRFPIYPTDGSAPKQFGAAPVGIVITPPKATWPRRRRGHTRLKQLGQNLLSSPAGGAFLSLPGRSLWAGIRVVEESQAAYHAGFSVWADSAACNLNLNDSFPGRGIRGADRRDR